MPERKFISKYILSKSKQLILLGIFAITFLLPKTTNANSMPTLEVKVNDTIAGYSTTLKTKNQFQNQEIQFLVKKPDNTQIIINSATDNTGEAVIDLYDYHTKQAGFYQAAAKFKNQNTFGPLSSFRVYPDEVSSTNSYVNANKKSASANGQDTITLDIYLRDDYGNPIPNHEVQVIPSRSLDTIKRISKYGYTDEKGKITFSVSSKTQGISVYSMLDATNDTTLEKRVEVVYYNSQNLAKNIGGDTDIFMLTAKVDNNRGGQVSYFEIDDVPQQIEINEITTFKVVAYDNEGNIATNYTGTIRFSSTDDHANLPQDYEFKDNDLGEHTFSLSLSFMTQGVQKLTVTDLDNPEIKGEKKIEVVSKTLSTATFAATDENKNITITYPTDGLYNERTLTISGETIPNKQVKIFLDDNEIGSTVSNTNGAFSLQTPNLSDGEHTLYAATADAEGNIESVSESASIVIDTSPPVVDFLEIEPSSQVAPGIIITIKLQSENNLSQTAVIIGETIVELFPSLENNGLYTGSIEAPKTPGNYKVDVILIDQLGNEASYEDQATIEVTTAAERGAPSKPALPPNITKLEAVPSDQRVTLFWEIGDYKADHFRVYYGISPDDLSNIIDTFDNSTTWYIPNLTNGQRYYFAVTAIDSQDNESEEKSQVVASTPQLTEETIVSVANIPPPEEGTPESGPETVLIIAFTIVFANLYFSIRKKGKQKEKEEEKEVYYEFEK